MQTKKEISKRLKTILILREKKFTLNEIGVIFDISRERVRQIIRDKDVIVKNKVQSQIWKYLVSVGKTEGRDLARELVRLRDKHTCQDCGIVILTKDVYEYNKKIKTKKGKIKSLDVHHTKGMCGKNSTGYDSPKDISEMVTLCHKCHYNRPEHRCQSSSFRKN